MPSDANLIFIISAFACGTVLILTKDRLPTKLRRGTAILATFLVAFAFFLVVYSLATAGL